MSDGVTIEQSRSDGDFPEASEPLGAEICRDTSHHKFHGQVRYCVYRETGYSWPWRWKLARAGRSGCSARDICWACVTSSSQGADHGQYFQSEEGVMDLNTVQDITCDIEALTPQQWDELYSWLDQHHPQPIDARIESDLAAGRLDDAIRRALNDENNSQVRTL